MKDYTERRYRDFSTRLGLARFSVKISETDLFILADSDLSDDAYHSALACRTQIEEYITLHEPFKTSLVPLDYDPLAPVVVKEMLDAAMRAGVGPMAAVAGAIAERVGCDLSRRSLNVIVENGGDIYLNVKDNVDVQILAGTSALSGRIAIRLRGSHMPLGICTSSGTVGHSLSLGKADAVCVLSHSAALADAAATAAGNLVRDRSDLKAALERAMSIEGVLGILIIIGDHLAAKGEIELAEV